MEEFAERVRRVATSVELNASSLGARLGLASSTAHNYWRGVRPWPTEVLVPLSDELRVDVQTLLTGQSTNVIGSEARTWLSRIAANEPSDFVEVSEIDLAYGLGGTFADGPVQAEIIRFERGWLESITRTPASLLTFARGRGDSMQPTVQDGDIVLIDRSVRTIRELDAIWAMTVGDIAMIKRVRPTGENVTILSDNERVPPYEVFHEEINVVGRVIFIGRKI